MTSGGPQCVSRAFESLSQYKAVSQAVQESKSGKSWHSGSRACSVVFGYMLCVSCVYGILGEI